MTTSQATGTHASQPKTPPKTQVKTMGYKAEQGRMARMAAFWTLAVLIFYGCTSLNATLAGQFPALGQPLVASLPKLPVLGFGLTPAFLISAVLCVGGFYLLHRWLAKPKNADLLIETEHELRKVTWPTMNEVINSSLVVVTFVLLLMGFLAAADWFLARVTRVILFGALS